MSSPDCLNIYACASSRPPSADAPEEKRNPPVSWADVLHHIEHLGKVDVIRIQRPTSHAFAVINVWAETIAQRACRSMFAL